MNFMLGQLQQLAMVVIIMALAIVGTIGLLKLIKQFSPGISFPQECVSKKPEEEK